MSVNVELYKNFYYTAKLGSVSADLLVQFAKRGLGISCVVKS